MLLYTVASQEATRIITDSPWMVQTAGEHRRAGINLASYALDALRRPSVISIARAAPFPRVTGLLDVIGDAPSETDAAGNWYFTLPDPVGGQHRLRIDEISLPGEPPHLPLAGGARARPGPAGPSGGWLAGSETGGGIPRAAALRLGPGVAHDQDFFPASNEFV